ncbi:MAG TPA: dephospho-CoA kinase [Spongiibacteraceae bacterium]|nr:dephospho-CoA kinase [Spongiibacteraceae bacterium]
MLVVGITGGIGSGKTAVTDIFATLGIDIVDADIAARVVVEPNTTALQQIAQHFGPQLIQIDGTLDRAALRRIIFQDATAKQWLEQLLHPLIGVEVRRQLDAAKSPYVIFVSPLLIEAKQHLFCNRILVVDVPEEIQLQRTVARDNNDAAQVQRIIASQANREQRLNYADDIIENTGSLEQLREQVEKKHRFYLELAKQHLERE